MSLAFYCDQHVQGPAQRALRARGVDVLNAEEDGSKQLADEEILARATSLGRVLITNDKGFEQIAARWRADGRLFAGIVRLTRQRMPYGQMIEELELIAKVHSANDVANQIIHVPL